MKRKILLILKWVSLMAYLVVALSFTSNKKSSINCNGIVININNKHKFLNQQIVQSLLNSNNIFIDSARIINQDFNKIEKIIESNEYVKNAEIYSNLNGEIFIDIEQRTPIMRIITDSTNIYIDEDCKIMSTCDYYTANIIVITGNLDSKFFFEENTSKQNKNSLNLQQLFDFVNFINADEFLKAQFEQIFVNSQGEIEIVPRVGNHIIILGSLENYKYKLGKLEALYKKGFTITDWNIYSTINLKYSDQVICKKR